MRCFTLRLVFKWGLSVGEVSGICWGRTVWDMRMGNEIRDMGIGRC